MTIDTVYQTVYYKLSRNINSMTKIQLKCWVYHSESRVKNGNDPFKFDDYIHRLGKDFYLDYIHFDFIDCEEFGGKDNAIEIVNRWFA